MEPVASALGAQGPNCWTTREALCLFISELIKRRQAKVVKGVDLGIPEFESALPHFAGDWLSLG